MWVAFLLYANAVGLILIFGWWWWTSESIYTGRDGL